jgi:hypothetical protein
MKDLDIKSFYRHDIPVNKSNKTKPNKNFERESHEIYDRIEDTSKNSKEKKRKSRDSNEVVERRRDLKGGDSSYNFEETFNKTIDCLRS